MEQTGFLSPRRKSQGTRSLLQQRRPWQRVSDSWLPEILALCMSILSLMGMALILGLYNNKPLAAWSQIISLNTALSSLGTFMKGFILVVVGSAIGQLKWLWYAEKKRPLQDFQAFDAASRGPWGSALLLVHSSRFSLASLGALATVLAILSDSFVQQSVAYPSRNVVQPDLEASVPYAQEYTSYVNDTTSPSYYYTNQSMMAAMYDGIFATNLTQSSSSLQVQCPTGNCTTEPYASLVIGAKCANVTALLNRTEDLDDPFGVFRNYSLPNGHYLVKDFNSREGYLNLTSSPAAPSAVTTRPGWPMNTNELDMYVSAGTIANFSIITAKPVAYDCTFFFGAQSYNSSSTLHMFQENITENHDRPTWKGIPDGPDPLDWKLGVFEAPASFGANRTFTVDQVAKYALTMAFTSMWGDVGIDVGGNYRYTSDIAQGFYYQELANVPIPTTADNIALAMTHVVRQAGNKRAMGHAWAGEPFIQVQWLWMLLPLAVVLLSAILLGLTLLRTRHFGIPNWRSNALATMAHGLGVAHPGHGPSEDGGLERSYSGLDAWGNGYKVKLHRAQAVEWGYQLRMENEHAIPSVYDPPMANVLAGSDSVKYVGTHGSTVVS